MLRKGANPTGVRNWVAAVRTRAGTREQRQGDVADGGLVADRHIEWHAAAEWAMSEGESPGEKAAGLVGAGMVGDGGVPTWTRGNHHAAAAGGATVTVAVAPIVITTATL